MPPAGSDERGKTYTTLGSRRVMEVLADRNAYLQYGPRMRDPSYLPFERSNRMLIRVSPSNKKVLEERVRRGDASYEEKRKKCHLDGLEFIEKWYGGKIKSGSGVVLRFSRKNFEKILNQIYSLNELDSKQD